MNEKVQLAIRQQMTLIRAEPDHNDARAHYYETTGMLRGLFYGHLIDSMQLVELTMLAGSAYNNAGKPW